MAHRAKQRILKHFILHIWNYNAPILYFAKYFVRKHLGDPLRARWVALLNLKCPPLAFLQRFFLIYVNWLEIYWLLRLLQLDLHVICHAQLFINLSIFGIMASTKNCTVNGKVQNLFIKKYNTKKLILSYVLSLENQVLHFWNVY